MVRCEHWECWVWFGDGSALPAGLITTRTVPAGVIPVSLQQAGKLAPRAGVLQRAWAARLWRSMTQNHRKSDR
jgi:hypothetical protein